MPTVHLEDDDEEREAHRQLRKQVVIRDREGELNPVPQDLTGHRLEPPSARPSPDHSYHSDAHARDEFGYILKMRYTTVPSTAASERTASASFKRRPKSADVIDMRCLRVTGARLAGWRRPLAGVRNS